MQLDAGAPIEVEGENGYWVLPRFEAVRRVQLPEFKPANAANVRRAFNHKLLGIAKPMRFGMVYEQGFEAAMRHELSDETPKTQ